MPPSYVDANVFVYAFLKPKRKLQPHETSIKESAKRIIARISAGEEVVTSVVHFSEVSNVIDHYMTFEEALALEKGLLLRENIQILEVTQDDYLNAVSTSEQYHIGINDSLAYIIMKKLEITKLYSFDNHFDCLSDIKRLIE